MVIFWIVPSQERRELKRIVVCVRFNFLVVDWSNGSSVVAKYETKCFVNFVILERDYSTRCIRIFYIAVSIRSLTEYEINIRND